MFLYTKVKGYFCSFLVSNIFLYTSLSLYRPTFFLRFYNPFFIHSFSPYYLVSKISLMLFWILSFFYEGRSCGSFYSVVLTLSWIKSLFLFLQFFVFFQKVQIFSFNSFIFVFRFQSLNLYLIFSLKLWVYWAFRFLPVHWYHLSVSIQ